MHSSAALVLKALLAREKFRDEMKDESSTCVNDAQKPRYFFSGDLKGLDTRSVLILMAYHWRENSKNIVYNCDLFVYCFLSVFNIILD